MRISDIISMGSRYLVLGVIVALFITAATLIIYRFFLKKRSIPIKKVLLWATFFCYIIVVLGATLMMRASFYEGRKIMPLFYSYREAWVDFSAVMWRNIILNILMFLPFGFLLPLCHRLFDSFWKTSAATFVFTSLIETVQYFLKLGIFEPDDLLNNTIGAMIGFGIYTLIFFKKRPIKRILALQIPLFITISAFSAIFIVYYAQPVGNIEGQYV
ncbi:MAG: VanZ family protein, partial [Clostridia bacterium]|nr:VanZ family protein [Clostridia bacterium]